MMVTSIVTDKSLARVTRTHARTHAHTHARTHARTHTHTHTHTHTETRVTYVNICKTTYDFASNDRALWVLSAEHGLEF